MFPNTDFPLKFLVGKTGVAVILKNIDYRRNEFKRLKILEKNQVRVILLRTTGFNKGFINIIVIHLS